MAHEVAPPPGRGGPGEHGPGRGRPRITVSGWNFLLLLPLVAVLYPPLYNRRSPELLGMPFFYWWQFLMVVVSVIVTALVYRMTRGLR